MDFPRFILWGDIAKIKVVCSFRQMAPLYLVCVVTTRVHGAIDICKRLQRLLDKL